MWQPASSEPCAQVFPPSLNVSALSLTSTNAAHVTMGQLGAEALRSLGSFCFSTCRSPELLYKWSTYLVGEISWKRPWNHMERERKRNRERGPAMPVSSRVWQGSHPCQGTGHTSESPWRSQPRPVNSQSCEIIKWLLSENTKFWSVWYLVTGNWNTIKSRSSLEEPTRFCTTRLLPACLLDLIFYSTPCALPSWLVSVPQTCCLSVFPRQTLGLECCLPFQAAQQKLLSHHSPFPTLYSLSRHFICFKVNITLWKKNLLFSLLIVYLSFLLPLEHRLQGRGYLVYLISQMEIYHEAHEA